MNDLSTDDAKVTSFAERTLKRRIAEEAIDTRLRRRFAWQIAVAALLLIGLGVLAYRSFYVDYDPDEGLVAAVTELRAQVRGLGETPVAPPAADIVEDAPEVVGIPGPEGPRGLQGPPGRDGRDGSPCAPSNPQCVGPPGEPGATGTPGATGEPGTAGAAGEPGATGAPGPQGEPGPAGAAGADGRGITSVQIVEVSQNECHLIVSFTDGTTQDAGAVDCPTPPLIPLP